MRVVTVAGQRLTLEDEPFAQGSEGTLHDIRGKANYVAKLFPSARLAATREPKLKALCRLPEMCSLPPNLCWPLNLLYDEQGMFRGFVMKRLGQHMTLNKLFEYPQSKAMINQRVAALISLANTLGRMHLCGVAMGDPGPQNIPVLADCTVQLIDVDSFAVKMPDGVTYPCLGCTPEYVAPELLRAAKGMSYAQTGIPFDAWTDCYALGVLVYRALFLGKHPSSYALQPGASGADVMPPLREREERGWVAAFVPRPQLCFPAGEPSMDAFPPYLIEAFRRTFVDGYADPHRRTTAFEWQEILTRYLGELVDCPVDERHAHWRGATECPYCAAEERSRALTNAMRAQAGLPPLQAPRTRKQQGRRARKGAQRASGTSGGGGSGGARGGGAKTTSAQAAVSGAASSATGSRAASATSAAGGAARTAAGVAAPSLNVAARGGSGALSAAAAAGKGRGLQTHAINAFNRGPVRWARWLCVAASYLTIYFVQPTSVFQNFVYFCVGMCSDVELLVTGLAGFIAGWKTAKSDARTNKPIAYRFFDAVAATLIAMVVAALVGGVLCLLIGDTAPFGGLFKNPYEYQGAARAMGLGR